MSSLTVSSSDSDLDAEWERALEQDRLEQQALEVNEGELEILEKPPQKAAHYHHNELFITSQSLETGWVNMRQCHSDLDEVSATQIVYHPERIRDIKVLSFENITKAWVEDNTVQLQDVGAQSTVCISAQTKALSNSGDHYSLNNGPFMRRFLDGYYPMRVRLEVHYPAQLLRLIHTQPVDAKRIDRNLGYVDIDVWVVGKLYTEVRFSRKSAG